MSSEHHDQGRTGSRCACRGHGVQEQWLGTLTQQLLRVAETPGAAGGEQHAGEGGRTAGCETGHVATILKR